ncbi:MAG TPA: hypothetical protein VMT63_07475 [Bacteroidales bacterium]|nr:hypothetical protein [Bacteroidales bacterium]
MISLKAESQEIKININVPESYKYMSLWIAANLNEGDLSVELLDPNGEKKGDFSVGCALSISRPAGTDQENTSHEVVQGRINKSINNPLKGTWVIRLNPKKATGQVQIEIDQHLPGTKKNDN